MQKTLVVLLIFLGVQIQAQECFKYDRAMQDGKYYLDKKYYDSALVEFQAAQIAARECGKSTKPPADSLIKVFEGLKALRKSAEDATKRAGDLLKIAMAEKLISTNALSYFFDNDNDSVAWVLDKNHRRFGIMNRKGQILPGGFNWVDTSAFKGEGKYITATRRDSITISDTTYFLNNLGKIISKGYADILNTEFQRYFYVWDYVWDNDVNDYTYRGNLIFYNGKTFETFIDVTSEINIEKPRPVIFPFRVDDKFGFIDKKGKQIFPPVYDELKIPGQTFSSPAIMAARNNGIWDLIDLINAKLLDSDSSLERLGHKIIIKGITKSIAEGDILVWSSFINKEKSENNPDYHTLKNLSPPTGWDLRDDLFDPKLLDTISAMAWLRHDIIMRKEESIGEGDSLMRGSFINEEQPENTIDYDKLRNSYPTIGEDSAFLSNARFKKIKSANGAGIGIINSALDTILSPVYDMIRYFYGDSIFFIGRKEINKGTSIVCQLFNASTGLFSSYQSPIDSIIDWPNGIWVNGPTDKNYYPKYDYSMYFTKNGKAVSTFNQIDADLADINPETGLAMKKGYGNAALFLAGKPLGKRNKVSSLWYWSPCKEGIYYDNNYNYKKMGVISTDGSILTPPIFDQIFGSSEGKRVAIMNGKYGFIDSTGWVLPCEYDYAWSFYDGKACVSKKGKWGFIDQKGRTIISFSYDGLVDRFTEGIVGAKKGTKWGYIDQQEKWAIDPVYDSVGGCFDGIIRVKKDGKWGFVDKTNKIQRQFTLDEEKYPAGNGWSRVNKNGKWGFINFKTLNNISAVYDTVYPFIGNYSWAKKGASWIILDTNGKPKFENKKIKTISPFENGYTIVETDLGKGIVDSVGNQIIPFAKKNKIVEIEENRLYIENDSLYIENNSGKIAKMLEIKKDGKIILKTIGKYPNLTLKNGLSATYDSITNREGEFFPELKYAYNLQLIAYRIYEFGGNYFKGYAAFTDYGTGIDDPSKPIKLIRYLPAEYEEIGFPLDQEFMPVKDNGKWGFIQWVPRENGTQNPVLAIPCKYDAVVPFFQIGNEKIAVVSKNNHVYFINDKDEVLFNLARSH